MKQCVSDWNPADNHHSEQMYEWVHEVLKSAIEENEIVLHDMATTARAKAQFHRWTISFPFTSYEAELEADLKREAEYDARQEAWEHTRQEQHNDARAEVEP